MVDIEGTLEKDTDFSFEEAVAYFMGKILVTPSQFRQIANQYKSLAFTVSGYTQIQILKRFYDELLAAIENGTTEEQFRQVNKVKPASAKLSLAHEEVFHCGLFCAGVLEIGRIREFRQV